MSILPEGTKPVHISSAFVFFTIILLKDRRDNRNNFYCPSVGKVRCSNSKVTGKSEHNTHKGKNINCKNDRLYGRGKLIQYNKKYCAVIKMCMFILKYKMIFVYMQHACILYLCIKTTDNLQAIEKICKQQQGWKLMEFVESSDGYKVAAAKRKDVWWCFFVHLGCSLSASWMVWKSFSNGEIILVSLCLHHIALGQGDIHRVKLAFLVSLSDRFPWGLDKLLL